MTGSSNWLDRLRVMRAMSGGSSRPNSKQPYSTRPARTARTRTQLSQA